MIDNLKVDKLYVNSLNHDSIAAKQIYNAAEINDTKLILAENNKIIFNEAGLKLTNFIAPNSLEIGDNEASILTLMKYKDFSMLFTGDSNAETFNKLKEFLPKNITVLKVGHHGGLGVVNKDMMNYLNPQISLISVGENKFGHPNLLTLNTLKNTKILRTDVNNAIKFVVNNKGLKIYSFNTRKKKFVLQ